MNHTCISTTKVNRLNKIAELSAIQSFETDPFIQLAFAVQEYARTEDDYAFDVMISHLENCRLNFTKFNECRQLLLHLLVENKTVTLNNPSQPTVDKDNTTTDNIINFPNKPKE